jgi:hypothetical protein
MAIVRSIIIRFTGHRVLTTIEDRNARMDTCDACEEQTDEGQCRVCTCYCLAKASLTMERCPRGKWERVWQKRRKNSLLR